MAKTLRCKTCGHYINPHKRRLYPNTDNEAAGWVTCAVGSTIRKHSMACALHTELAEDELDEAPEKRRLIK